MAGDFRAGLLKPFAAAARICLFVSADGRLSLVVFAREVEVGFAFRVFLPDFRTVALTFVAPLTVGNLTSFLVAVLPRPVFVSIVFLAAAFPRLAAALETAFLTPALIDLGVRSLRFLP